MHLGTGRATTEPPTSRVELLGLYAERVLPLAVILVAVVLRVYRLDTIPRGLLYDEVFNGLDVLKILDGERPIFLTGNFGREALFVYLQAISVAVLGQTSLALRVVPAIAGILTVVAAYFLTRRMFSSRVALLTCGWLTVSIWHVIFSRTGLRSVSLPLFLAVGFYCLWRGLEGVSTQVTEPSGSTAVENGPRPAIWFALGGIAIGLSLYTYSAARFAPFVIVALAVYLAVIHRQLLPKVLPGLVLALTLATLVFLPEGLFFLRHPDSLLERAQRIWIFNPEIHQGDPGKALLDSAINSLGAFAIRGDGAVDRNIPGQPIFDPISALLMLIGLALLLRRFRQPAYGFAVMCLLIMFIPSLLTNAGTPSYLRTTALIPMLFILPALGFDRLWQAWELRAPAMLRALPVLLVTLAFLSGAIHTYHSYFEVWPDLPRYSQVFSTDKIVTLEVALKKVRTEQEPIFVAGSDYDDPWVQFTLPSHPESHYVRTFDYTRSVIFPVADTSATYLFTPGLPQSHVLDRYFDESTVQFIETTPSGQPITTRTLLDPRPPFEPGLVVPARFGDQLLVDGFDVPKDTRAGGTMTVRWYWHLLAADEREFGFTNQLFGEDDLLRGHYDARGFAPGYWRAGTSGITTFEMDIDPETPTGAYWLRVAVYDRGSQEFSRLDVFDARGNHAGNQLILGPIKVHARTSATLADGLGSQQPSPENLLPAIFADQINLQGYSLSDHRLTPGGSLNLTLFWSPRGRPTLDYAVFVHLLDSEGQLRGQADSPPKSGKYPTSVWDAGEVIDDLHTLSLDPDLPAGEYRLVIGLYNPETGQRVRTLDENYKVLGDLVMIPGLILDGE